MFKKKIFSTKNKKKNRQSLGEIKKKKLKNKLILDPSLMKLHQDILKKNTMFNYLKNSNKIIKKSAHIQKNKVLEKKHKKSLSNNFFSEFKRRNKNQEKSTKKRIHHLKSLTSSNLNKDIGILKNILIESNKIKSVNKKSHFSHRKQKNFDFSEKNKKKDKIDIEYDQNKNEKNHLKNLYFKQEKLRSFVKSVKKLSCASSTTNSKMIHHLLKKIKNKKKKDSIGTKKKIINYDYIKKYKKPKKNKNGKIIINNNINIKNNSINKKNQFKGKINIMIDFNDSNKNHDKNSFLYKATPQGKILHKKHKKRKYLSSGSKKGINSKKMILKVKNRKQFQSKQNSPNQNYLKKKHRKMQSNVEFSKKSKKIIFNLKIDLNNKNLKDKIKQNEEIKIKKKTVQKMIGKQNNFFLYKKARNKVKHRKNVLSLPDKNVVKNYLKNINLPINLLNSKKVSMTPDISKNNSPRNKKKKLKKKIFKIKKPDSIIKITEREEELIYQTESEKEEKSLMNLENISLHSYNPEEDEDTKRKKVKESFFTNNILKKDLLTQIKKANQTKESDKTKLIEKILNFTKTNKDIPETSLEFYDIISLLGEGSYGKVYLGKSILTDCNVAIKCYDRIKIKNQTTCKRILQEIDILRSLDHDNIIKIYEIFDNKKYIFIVMEFANSGDLLYYLKKNGKFEEKDFLPILKQIIQSLNHLHSKRILHRDIKLDNILLTEAGNVKICDFGVSRLMPEKNLIFEHIGTPAYLAPEIIHEKGYKGFSADIWSLGVMSFIALSGQVPFRGEKIEELHYNILNKKINVDDFSVNISNKLKNVIIRMLEKNPKKRISLKKIAEILNFKIKKYIQPNSKIDFNLVNRVSKLGFQKKIIIKTLKADKINHVSALYKILKH